MSDDNNFSGIKLPTELLNTATSPGGPAPEAPTNPNFQSKSTQTNAFPGSGTSTGTLTATETQAGIPANPPKAGADQKSGAITNYQQSPTSQFADNAGTNVDFLPQNRVGGTKTGYAVNYDDGRAAAQRQKLLTLMLIFLVSGGFVYFDGISIVESMFFAEKSVEKIAAKPTKKVTKRSDRIPGVVPENPYWDLPNPVGTKKKSGTRRWSEEERQLWSAGMSSRYVYQRLKTILEVRNFGLVGSEEILWQGIEEKKLWTRMAALIGLAEFGIEVDIDSIDSAIGEERSSLVANYFKRFGRTLTDAEYFVMRASLRLVDARGRLAILKNLSQQPKTGLRDLYLVAATYDPGKDIKDFAMNALRGTKQDLINNYADVILGRKDFNGKTITKQKSESLDEAADQFATEVEFYEGIKTQNLENTDGLLEDSTQDGFEELEAIEIKDL